ncbi:MAG: flippase-like domain-containing protein [Myxococcales bacterium]|nr:flippase-like domain-containing protein [Myxococcales bacterium]MCB9708610.1 flippase-like domain-containing protein [Myxococcales bacterium]
MLRRDIIAKLAVSVVIGALFAWLVARGGVPLWPSASSFAHVTWWAVPLYLLTLAISHWFRATRWRFLLTPVTSLKTLEVVRISWVGFFAIFALPLRVGEVVRPAVLKLRHGVSLSAGLGTIAVERVIDGLVTSLCVVWAVFFLPRLPSTERLVQSLPYYAYVTLIVFVAAIAFLALFLYQRGLAAAFLRRSIGMFSKRAGDYASEKLASVAQGLESLAQPKLLVPFLVETGIYWALNALGMWLLAKGCGLPLSLGHAVGLMGILAIGVLLPSGPGLFGNFQLAVSIGLKLYLAGHWVIDEGAVYIFLLYSIQALFIAITGLIPLYFMKLRLRDVL